MREQLCNERRHDPLALAANRRVQEKNVSKTAHKKEPTHIKQKELKQHNYKQVEGEEMLIEACRIGTH